MATSRGTRSCPGTPLAPLARLAAALLVLCWPLAAQDSGTPATAPQTTPPAETKPDAQTKPASTAPATQDAQPPPPIVPTPPAQKGIKFKAGDYDVAIGGYIKVDLIHDFDDIGDTDSFDVRTIPVTNGVDPGTNTRLHARQTRLNLDVRGPSSEGEMRVFVEGDFFGSGNSFRMRHAYGQIRQLLAGQTWSTFMDDDAMPETLDFESPIAFPQIRQTQVRWTIPLEDKDYFAVAVEDPDSDVIPPPNETGTVKEPYPDLTARLRLNNSIGHVQVGLFTGMARFVPDNGTADDALLWGTNVSTKLTTVDKDNAIAQITYGPGVGRYRGGTAAGFESNGNLVGIPIFGWLLSYQHYWNDEYRSSIGYSEAHADLPGDVPSTSNTDLTYSFVNFIRQYTSRCWFGVEFLHGTREVNSGANGDANRVQFSIRFDI